MTTVYLIRHAEAEGNLYRRAQGHADSAVTDRGYRQIAALERRFADVPIDAVYASDLFRTRTTALAITQSHGLPLHTTPLLREINIAGWEDHTWAYLTHEYREQMIAFNSNAEQWNIPGGEPAAALRERMLRALHQIIAENPDRTVAVFSHGMALRMLVGTLQGMTIAQIDETGHGENTAVTRLEAENGQISVIYRDDASHLPEGLTSLKRQTWWRNRYGIETSGIYYAACADDTGHFRIMNGEEQFGDLRVHAEDNACVIDDYELIPSARSRGYGVQAVGQALSFGRKRGACDWVRITIPNDNDLAMKRFLSYGFAVAADDGRATTLEKYLGRDDAYALQKFNRARQEI